MKTIGKKPVIMVLTTVLVVFFVWIIFSRLQEQGNAGERGKGPQAAPVEVARIQQGSIELRRTFSGALEAPARFVVAPKVSGRIERVLVDLADTVKRGQVVAELDDDEYIQAVAQARADLAVARANLTEAESALEIAAREYRRIETLRKRGATSDAQLDTAEANQLAKQAQLEVARARLAKAEAFLETANIRLGYTRVKAGWTGEDEERVVSERYVDEGDTVSANTPLMSIVALHPMTGVIYVTEKDYGSLQPGQPVSLTTDAYDETFPGHISRIAPVFREATRQAKVELTVENRQHRLKPGMFIRATVVLDRMPEAVIVPDQALTSRDDRVGVFVVSEDGRSVSWREVDAGIREGGRVQVKGEGLTGRVVTLGQQLLDDGSPITIPGEEKETAAAGKEAGAL